MAIAVVGAGVTGSTLARCLAEKGHRVHVYESSNHYGGLAYWGRYACKLFFGEVKPFLLHRCDLREIGDGVYYPAESWHLACKTLLQHPNILSLFSAPITHPNLLCENYQTVYATVRVDKLYGCDLEAADILPDVARWTFAQYKQQAQAQGITLVGMQELFTVLPIGDAIQQVLQLAQHF